MMRNGILAAGNWIVDRVKIIDVYPEQDNLANIRETSLGNGGAPFSVLVDIAKLGIGIPLYALGCIGDDEDGRWIIDRCREAGINTSLLIRQPDEVTSYTDAMTVESTGRRTFFHARGANATLTADHFELGVHQAKILHLGYLLLLDQLDQPHPQFGTEAGRALAKASEVGMLTSIDVVSEQSDRFSSVVIPTLPNVDIAFLNEFELEKSASIPIQPTDPASIAAGARVLFANGLRRLAVVHTPSVVVACSPDGSYEVQPTLKMPAEHILGSTGAGDACAAGFLVGIHQGWPIKKCLETAVCVAAASLRAPGASDGVESLDACLSLGVRFGFR